MSEDSLSRWKYAIIPSRLWFSDYNWSSLNRNTPKTNYPMDMCIYIHPCTMIYILLPGGSPNRTISRRRGPLCIWIWDSVRGRWSRGWWWSLKFRKLLKIVIHWKYTKLKMWTCLHPHNHFALRDSFHHVHKSLGNLVKTFHWMFVGLQQINWLEIPM